MTEQPDIAAQDISGLNFEDALRALEDVVRRLESGDTPLEESIDLYTHGNLLRAHCQARLDAAQARIEAIVTGADGQPTGLRPFDDTGAR
ncbi:exodeoxyribonuclease VII small subunit [Novosphingobium sp. Gsoil 351]|uniref:exodeoxyribonuclease VII small subunit n=1 Tax=Novosphingobium sp. Gsoil 351 TaxID=2675225 RepID=UPI0012B4653C|nr:exodeoxyribonuclease VII small subunit [Novosphingobium sp. Gsoil 351]QGN56281.1 exodeoxyribonuclease VII small subunit [Novosphingobium sp. Gsoil 351]